MKFRSIPVIYRKSESVNEYSEEQKNVLKDLGQWTEDEGDYESRIMYMYLIPEQYRIQLHQDIDNPGRTIVEFCDDNGVAVTSAICMLNVEQTLNRLYGNYECDPDTTSI